MIEQGELPPFERDETHEMDVTEVVTVRMYLFDPRLR